MTPGGEVRARVGQLYPSGGLCEHEVQLMAPEGVRFLTTRVPFVRSGVDDDLGFADGVAEHSELLAHAEVDLIAVNCTAATMLAGPDVVNRRVRERTGIDSVTTIEGVMAALQRLGMRRVGLVTPYVAEVVEAETEYLERHGLHVVRTAGTPCETPVEQGRIPSSHWVEVVRGLPLDGIDGILLSCAGIQVASVIEDLEEITGLPVVTSNQALLWWALRTLGIDEPVPGHGRLLRS
jgi:maleate isomerase